MLFLYLEGFLVGYGATPKTGFQCSAKKKGQGAELFREDFKLEWFIPDSSYVSLGPESKQVAGEGKPLVSFWDGLFSGAMLVSGSVFSTGSQNHIDLELKMIKN